MTTRDEEIARKVTGYLDQGTAAMRAGTAYRLQLARQEALARLAAPQRVNEPQLAGALAGGAGVLRPGSGGRSVWTSARLWLGIGIIVAATFGYQEYQSWQAQQYTTELVETDAAILTSELPIDAYLDRGFQNWINHLDEK